MSNSCVGCQEKTNKYKCPKCIQYYCSAACYAIHKSNANSCQEKSKSTNNQVDDIIKDKLSAVRDPFTTEDTVPIEKLQMLEHSDELKHLLYNRHLRNFLKEIDTAYNASQAMRAAMQEPLFIEFADACLKIIEPNEEIEGKS